MGVITGDSGYRHRYRPYISPKPLYPVKPHTGICEKCGDSTTVEMGSYSVCGNRKTGMVCKDCREEEI